MKDSREINQFLDQYLITIQKPGRYTGGEYNQIKKEWDATLVKVALAFPDLYEIGFSNLGLAILYEIINSQPFALAERVFSPWIDLESLLRSNDIPLHSLESKSPLSEFNLIGFSIPYETLYTNVLNMLDLAQIPILANERKETDPIVIAGGHACFNPEPMHAIIDAFVIGDGEDVIMEILLMIKKGLEMNFSRRKMIDSLGEVEGIYIPSHFQISYFQEKISKISNIFIKNKNTINKRIVNPLPPPPTHLLVPNIQVVHDRFSMEIMRGCSRGCRFCQAGFINRPIRERPVEEIISSIEKTYKNTGYEEVGLLSLSSSDYSCIKELLTKLSLMSQNLQFTFSLPSLRIESFDQELINVQKNRRKGNFTLAPETASESIRRSINKPISDQDLMMSVEEIFGMGWRNLKLYFMIGFPNETLDDVQKIPILCKKVKAIGKTIIGRNVKIHISINTFIPKPHTPLQWVPLERKDLLEKKYHLILNELRGTGIKIDWSDYDEVLLESVLSRGDRHLSEVIVSAWQKGCKFDAWHDHFDAKKWQEAFDENKIKTDIYISQTRDVDDLLPWDHINTGISKDFLKNEYRKSHAGLLTQDCKDGCHLCGIELLLDRACANLREKDKQ